MHLQTVPPQVLPLLLLLLSSPLGGRSLPLGSPDPDLEASAVQPSQELRDRPRAIASELQEEQMTQEPLPQDRRSAEAWEATEKDAAGAREPHHEDFQALQGLETSAMMPVSSCFGRKIDRIRYSSDLGCKAVYNYKGRGQEHQGTTIPWTDEETEAQRDGLLQRLKCPDQPRDGGGPEENIGTGIITPVVPSEASLIYFL